MKHITAKQKFWIGLAACLAGAGLVWAGDGSESLYRKAIVVTGVILVVGGIGILRYLLFAKKQMNERKS